MHYVTTEVDTGGRVVRRALGIPPELSGASAVTRKYASRLAAIKALDKMGGLVPAALTDEHLALALAFPVDG